MPIYRSRLYSGREARKKLETRPGGFDPKKDVDRDACLSLLFAVLETAINDYKLVRSLRGRRLTDAERKRLRAVTEDSDPEEFFTSRWFEELCGLMGLRPDAVREEVGLSAGRQALEMAS